VSRRGEYRQSNVRKRPEFDESDYVKNRMREGGFEKRDDRRDSKSWSAGGRNEKKEIGWLLFHPLGGPTMIHLSVIQLDLWMLSASTAMHFTLMEKSSLHLPAITRSLECAAFRARSDSHSFRNHQPLFVICSVEGALSPLIFASISVSIMQHWPSLLWASKLTTLSLALPDHTPSAFMESSVIEWGACFQRIQQQTSHMHSCTFMILMRHWTHANVETLFVNVQSCGTFKICSTM
jgi:hypothetical protein